MIFDYLIFHTDLVRSWPPDGVRGHIRLPKYRPLHKLLYTYGNVITVGLRCFRRCRFDLVRNWNNSSKITRSPISAALLIVFFYWLQQYATCHDAYAEAREVFCSWVSIINPPVSSTVSQTFFWRWRGKGRISSFQLISGHTKGHLLRTILAMKYFQNLGCKGNHI